MLEARVAVQHGPHTECLAIKNQCRSEVYAPHEATQPPQGKSGVSTASTTKSTPRFTVAHPAPPKKDCCLHGRRPSLGKRSEGTTPSAGLLIPAQDTGGGKCPSAFTPSAVSHQPLTAIRPGMNTLHTAVQTAERTAELPRLPRDVGLERRHAPRKVEGHSWTQTRSPQRKLQQRIKEQQSPKAGPVRDRRRRQKGKLSDCCWSPGAGRPSPCMVPRRWFLRSWQPSTSLPTRPAGCALATVVPAPSPALVTACTRFVGNTA